MTPYISAQRLSLDKIFSDSFDYHIPYYQRPYSWKKKHVTAMFNDLVEAATKQKDTGYFLGCLVLVKEQENPKTNVVDGQQRLTTLTMLLALLAKRCSERRETLNNLIFKKDGATSPRLRLTLREEDELFFNHSMQDLDFEKYGNSHMNSFSEPKRLIVTNAMAINKCIDNLISKEDGNNMKLEELVSFLLSKCYLVTITTRMEDSALRLFEVVNSRGLVLSKTDILKAEVIQKISPDERPRYSRLWEERERDLESEVGKDAFDDLFGHLYMIFFKERPRRRLVEEFRTKIKKDFPGGKEFVTDVIVPYAEAWELIYKEDFDKKSDKDADINDCFHWLNHIGNSDWLPPALKFLVKHRHSQDDVAWYMNKLERLAGVLRVSGKNMNYRFRRYKKLLEELDGNYGKVTDLEAIELEDDEHNEVLDDLDKDIYSPGKVGRYKYIVQRLNGFMSDKKEKYRQDVTVEHILPQTVPEGSVWEKIWPDLEEHNEWVNRLANLNLVLQSMNSAASNKDLADKKVTFFQREKKTDFALNFEINDVPDEKWDKEYLMDRQLRMIGYFKKYWEIERRPSSRSLPS